MEKSVNVGLKPFLLSVLALFSCETVLNVAVLTELVSPDAALAGIRVTEIILFILIFMIWDHGPACLGLAREQLVPGVKQGILWSAGFGVIVMIGAGVLFLMGKNPFEMLRVPLPETSGEMIFFLCLRGVIGPVAEEIFFRGILYSFLRRWGIFIAFFFSSLIFVAVHPVRGIPQMVGGALFAAAYEIEGKLMTPITIHILGNMAIFMVASCAL